MRLSTYPAAGIGGCLRGLAELHDEVATPHPPVCPAVPFAEALRLLEAP